MGKSIARVPHNVTPQLPIAGHQCPRSWWRVDEHRHRANHGRLRLFLTSGGANTIARCRARPSSATSATWQHPIDRFGEPCDGNPSPGRMGKNERARWGLTGLNLSLPSHHRDRTRFTQIGGGLIFVLSPIGHFAAPSAATTHSLSPTRTRAARSPQIQHTPELSHFTGSVKKRDACPALGRIYRLVYLSARPRSQ